MDLLPLKIVTIKHAGDSRLDFLSFLLTADYFKLAGASDMIIFSLFFHFALLLVEIVFVQGEKKSNK